jgi:hypothetical protein
METEPPESQHNMIKRMVLGNLEIPVNRITGSIYHIEKTFHLGGLFLSIRQEEDLPDMNLLMFPYNMIDMRDLSIDELKETRFQIGELLHFSNMFDLFSPQHFYSQLEQWLVDMLDKSEQYLNQKIIFVEQPERIDLTSDQIDLTLLPDPLKIEDIEEPSVVVKIEDVDVVVKKKVRIPNDYLNILRDQFIGIQSYELAQFSNVRINFFLTLEDHEIDEMFDIDPRNLYCIRPIIFKNHETFNGLNEVLRWYDTDKHSCAQFFYDHLTKYTSKSIQFWITNYCQCLLKNFMRLYLTFNNDVFETSYKYGTFTQEELRKNIPNFRILRDFTRYPVHLLDFIDTDFCDNSKEFKFKIPPKWSNLKTLCRAYADFKSDHIRLTSVMEKFNRLNTVKSEIISSVFQMSDHDLSLLEQKVNQFYGSRFLNPVSQKIEELYVEKELIKIKSKSNQLYVEKELELVQEKSIQQSSAFIFQILGAGILLYMNIN